ncbi:hypothetical protein UJ101_02227 [Flavobacteriaceae bacterium UJ101]|nr:hypothetical protein UJ101_02227 [Flavobacteriaceae bacterium UJ101]
MFKKIIIIIGIVLLGNWAKAQDPGVSDVVITPGVVESGGNATFSFNLYNASSTGLTTWSSGDSFALQVIVSLSDAVPSDTSTISNSITGTWSGKFDWSYDSGSNTITGIQKEDIAGETLTVPSAGSIEIAVENTAESAQSDPNCGFIVNLTPPATAVSMNLDDDSKNIYAYTTALLDSDGDGIPDVTDIDDDNDGILDTEESGCAKIFPLNNLGFEETTEAQWPTGQSTLPHSSVVGQYQWHKFQGSQVGPDYTVDIDTPGSAGTGLRLMENIAESPYGGRAVWASSSNTLTEGLRQRVDGLTIGNEYELPLAYTSDGSYSQSNNMGLTFRVYDTNGTTLLHQETVSSSVSNATTAEEWEEYTFKWTATQSDVVIRVSGLQSSNAQGIVFDGPSSCLDIDTDGDGIPNRLDLDSDGDGCSDAFEAGVTTDTTTDYKFPTTNIGSNGFVDSLETSTDSGVYDGTYTYDKVIDGISACVCSKSPLTTGTPEVTKAGISTLNQTPTDNWPLDVNNGFIVLESINKGFVVTRHTTAELSNIENPIEGMLIYDTTAKCLKLYKNGAWTCVKKSCN